MHWGLRSQEMNRINAYEKNYCHFLFVHKGLKNEKGQVLALLFNSEEGFPGEKEQAVALKKLKVSHLQTGFSFEGLSAGKYAISLVHDENGNGKMDSKIFEVPSEGYGTSNNVKTTLRPPSFEEAKIHLNNPSKSISISVFYL